MASVIIKYGSYFREDDTLTFALSEVHTYICKERHIIKMASPLKFNLSYGDTLLESENLCPVCLIKELNKFALIKMDDNQEVNSYVRQLNLD